MIGKIFYYLGLIESNEPIEFVKTMPASELPLFNQELDKGKIMISIKH